MKSTIDELKHTREQVEKLSKEIVTLRDSVHTLEKDLDDCRKGINITQKK
jgi:predicted  nucleic acid-binding Zn-ribbon protein